MVINALLKIISAISEAKKRQNMSNWENISVWEYEETI